MKRPAGIPLHPMPGGAGHAVKRGGLCSENMGIIKERKRKAC